MNKRILQQAGFGDCPLYKHKFEIPGLCQDDVFG